MSNLDQTMIYIMIDITAHITHVFIYLMNHVLSEIIGNCKDYIIENPCYGYIFVDFLRFLHLGGG